MNKESQNTLPKTQPVELSKELRQSYLDYAMSVIVGRALPDVQDGLKPVHRRVLYAMYRMGSTHSKPYKKSAAVVGDVLGKYHPHGDSAVYDSLVRMAQPFSMRNILIDGQGNFGSIDGDSAAAMRYTEVRLDKLSEEMLTDIDKETVTMVKNYDDTLMEPVVLPARIPNLLVNGSSGIAVGMATNIPPHNLSEVINAAIHVMENSDCTVEDLIKIMPGPDFPTGGIMMGVSGVKEAYTTGKGRVVVRSCCEIEEKKGRSRIIITEIPFMVNKSRMLERIAELVRNKKLSGITEIRDESNKNGIRVVITIARGENPQVILNNLYSNTSVQSSFSINMVALHNRQPKLMTLKQILNAFIDHRKQVITKRTIYELKQARNRAHILEGFAVSIANIDPIIQLIKTSPDPKTAKKLLMERGWESKLIDSMLKNSTDLTRLEEGMSDKYGQFMKEGKSYYHLSEKQAQSILELKLQRLTMLEQDKIIREYKECIEKIKEYLNILDSFEALYSIIKNELLEVRDKYLDKRRTEVSFDNTDLSIEDLIEDEEKLITLSHRGYCKIQSTDEFRAQGRGGRGKIATTTRHEDFIEHLVVGFSHSQLLCFSNFGKVYWAKVHQLPEANRNSRGKPISNILPMASEEKIQELLSIDTFDTKSIVMVTERGNIKKVPLKEFSTPRMNGKIAIKLAEGDSLAKVALADNEETDIMLFTSEGRALRFVAKQVRSMGRTAKGSRGVTMKHPDARVIGLITIDPSKQILVATDRGIGKRVDLTHFNSRSRGGKGVAVIPKKATVGNVIGVCQVKPSDGVMLISSGGILIRMKVENISKFSRDAKGVTLLKLEEGDTLVAMAPIYEDKKI